MSSFQEKDGWQRDVAEKGVGSGFLSFKPGETVVALKKAVVLRQGKCVLTLSADRMRQAFVGINRPDFQLAALKHVLSCKKLCIKKKASR